MVGHKVRIALLGLAILSLGVSQAQAFCHGCHRWFGGAPATAYYAPAPVAVTAAYAPAPCGSCAPACPQVVNYAPQTCYRTVYVNTPVVAYQPVAACNPCTGCATTVMRPVTSYVMQPRMVAYTSYRPVVTAGYAPACPTCAPAAPVATAAYYAPAVAPAAPAPCCGASYAPAPAAGVATAAPGAVVQRVIQQPAPYATQPQPAQVVAPPYSSEPAAGPSTTVTPPSSAPGQTFREDAPQNGEPQSRIVQPQSTTIQPNTLGAPRALDSEDQDRTTALPLRQALAVKPVSRVAPVTSTIQLNDESGWRASH